MKKRSEITLVAAIGAGIGFCVYWMLFPSELKPKLRFDSKGKKRQRLPTRKNLERNVSESLHRLRPPNLETSKNSETEGRVKQDLGQFCFLGKVEDRVTRMPVVNALVIQRNGKIVAKSDANGEFSFCKKVETVKCFIESLGHDLKEVNLRCSPSKVKTTILLESASCGKLDIFIDFREPPPNRITVFIDRHKIVFDTGQYISISDLKVGTHWVGIGGYRLAASVPILNKTVRIFRGKTTRADFELSAPVDFSGRVEDSQGNGLRNATIYFNSLVVVSGDGGKFHGRDFPEGEYTLKLVHDHFGKVDLGRLWLKQGVATNKNLLFVVEPNGVGEISVEFGADVVQKGHFQVTLAIPSVHSRIGRFFNKNLKRSWEVSRVRKVAAESGTVFKNLRDGHYLVRVKAKDFDQSFAVDIKLGKREVVEIGK